MKTIQLINQSSGDNSLNFNAIQRFIQELAQVIHQSSDHIKYDRLQQLISIKDMWERNIETKTLPITNDDGLDDDLVTNLSIYDDKIIETNDSIETTESIETNEPIVNLKRFSLVKYAPKRGRPLTNIAQPRYNIKNCNRNFSRSQISSNKIIKKAKLAKLKIKDSIKPIVSTTITQKIETSFEVIHESKSLISSSQIAILKRKEKDCSTEQDVNSKKAKLQIDIITEPIIVELGTGPLCLKCNSVLLKRRHFFCPNCKKSK